MVRRYVFLLFACLFLASCGFRPAGRITLAPPLHRMYLQAVDPYSTVAYNLRKDLAMYHISLAATKEEADTILVLDRDQSSQALIGISSTQQVSQYNLKTSIQFEILDKNGRLLVDTQTLSEERIMTIQSDQILGGSNEAELFYQQMRRNLAIAIINRLASKEITKTITDSFSTPKQSKMK